MKENVLRIAISLIVGAAVLSLWFNKVMVSHSPDGAIAGWEWRVGTSVVGWALALAAGIVANLAIDYGLAYHRRR